jgi:hypothetical protein
VVYGAPKRMRFYSVCPSPVVYFELNKNKILLHPIVQPIPQVHVSPWVLKRSRSGARVSSTCLTLAQGLLQSVGSHILLALGGHGLLADLPVARGGRHRGSLHAVVRTTGNQPHTHSQLVFAILAPNFPLSRRTPLRHWGR